MARATAAPPLVRLVPPASLSCTAMVEVLVPFAVIEVGEAVMVDVAGEAVPAAAEAVKVTGLPLGTAAVAVTVLLLVPAKGPSVQLAAVAIPEELVETVTGPAGTTIPLPAVTAKVTATPATGLELASATLTEGGAATAVPTIPLWVVAEFATIVAAAPAPSVTPPEVTDVRPGALN